jgi:hypothetical protein
LSRRETTSVAEGMREGKAPGECSEEQGERWCCDKSKSLECREHERNLNNCWHTVSDRKRKETHCDFTKRVRGSS